MVELAMHMLDRPILEQVSFQIFKGQAAVEASYIYDIGLFLVVFIIFFRLMSTRLVSLLLVLFSFKLFSV